MEDVSKEFPESSPASALIVSQKQLKKHLVFAFLHQKLSVELIGLWFKHQQMRATSCFSSKALMGFSFLMFG